MSSLSLLVFVYVCVCVLMFAVECLCQCVFVCECVCGCMSACLHLDVIGSAVLCFLVQQLEIGHVCSYSFEREVCGW